MIQRKSFPELFSDEESFGETGKGESFSKFAPFSDSKHANLSFEQRHPVLLATKHDMITTMLPDFHYEHNHEGVGHARSVIQQKFWITGLRNALRSIKSSCVICRKLRA